MNRYLAFAFMGLLVMSPRSHAFKFSPMSTSINSSDKTKSTLFYLENDSDQPIAVTASLFKREMNVKGEEENKKVDQDIVVYPSQLIIPPNEKRSVKVTWEGKALPSAELAYRLIAEQLPIELDKNKKKKSSIKVLLRYVAALYVTAEDYNSDVSFTKLEVNDKHVVFFMANKGKRHQVLSSLSLKVSGKKEIEFSSAELAGMSGENILALSERSFLFAKNGKFKDIQSTDQVKINFEKD